MALLRKVASTALFRRANSLRGKNHPAGKMSAVAGSSAWLAERRQLLRGPDVPSGAQQCSSSGGGGGGGSGGGGVGGSSPWWLSALAWMCVLWTVLVAGLRYGPFSSPSPAATGVAAAAAAAAPPAESRRARSVAERHACLDLVVGEMLLIDPSVSSPRQAALVWLVELLVAQGVRGDVVESGSKHGGAWLGLGLGFEHSKHGGAWQGLGLGCLARVRVRSSTGVPGQG